MNPAASAGPRARARDGTVAALFVARGGAYWDLPEVDPWDEQRDARLYAGPTAQSRAEAMVLREWDRGGLLMTEYWQAYNAAIRIARWLILRLDRARGRSMRGIFATSSLRHARKRDSSGQLVGVTMCGARTTRTGDDAEVTCANCKRLLTRRRAVKP